MLRKSGFTVIELLIVVAVIAIIAAIAIPNLLASRLRANETAAVATLRTITAAQAQFHVSAKCDIDGDGYGEFGVFRELSGLSAVRTAADGSAAGGRPLVPPMLSGKFQMVTGAPNKYVTSSGYLFGIVLPADGGGALAERASTFAAPANTDLCETIWCCYAVPATYGTSGNRTFFVNQSGEVTAKEDASASAGAGHAFAVGGPLSSITGRQAIGTVGRDGFVWSRVN